jgi:glycosyltransferase involved in cell wall biosynthesis
VRICILSSQYFGWGKYGGFGSMTRRLAEALAGRGVATHVIVPLRAGQEPLETINGVSIHGFKGTDLFGARRLLREVPADLYHSQEPSLLTLLAQWVRPRAVHLVTSRDPRNIYDWWIEFRDATPGRRLLTPLNYLTEGGPLVGLAVHRAHGIYAPAHCVRKRAKRIYLLRNQPGFLPNLIRLPKEKPVKAEKPTVTFFGRLDQRKHPERFLSQAERFPGIRFQVVGKAEDEERDRYLRRRFGDLPNVEWIGFVSYFREWERMSAILERSWALVNTSSREGLPLTFQEAAAFGCAIISGLDPDGFASRFGIYVKNNDFQRALQYLSDHPEEILERGELGRAYIRAHYEHDLATDLHLKIYESFLSRRR